MSVALVLSEDAGAGPFTFPGFPGVWASDTPIEAQVFVDAGAFGSVDAMLEAVTTAGLPLEEITVAKGAAPLPDRPNHLPNADEAKAMAEKALDEMTHDELDARGADLDGYPRSANKSEKVAFLEATMTDPEAEQLAAEAADAAATEAGGGEG